MAMKGIYCIQVQYILGVCRYFIDVIERINKKSNVTPRNQEEFFPIGVCNQIPQTFTVGPGGTNLTYETRERRACCGLVDDQRFG